jgi:hypothetical protein
MRFWPQDEPKIMYAISLLNNSEGLQKWLAPCSMVVHRVARTIDVRTVEQESHRQTKFIL